jgi:acyl carrier protein
VSAVAASEVREVLLDRLADGLRRADRDAATVTDSTDFFAEQLLDSFGFLELILDLESRFAISIDFEELDGDDFTVVGPFCSYVEQLGAR